MKIEPPEAAQNPPKLNAASEGRALTIALGFRCQDGIVMCADSKEIYPDHVKVDTEKIRSSQGQFGTFIFTGATSDADVLESAILRIKEELFSKQHSNTVRFRHYIKPQEIGVDDGIRSAMNKVREESILPFPADQQPWCQLLTHLRYTKLLLAPLSLFRRLFRWPSVWVLESLKQRH